MKRTKTALLGILISSIAATGQQKLTLEKAIATALELNHSLRSASYNLDAAQWGTRNAVTNFLPRVELSSSFTRIDPESDHRANASIEFIKASAGALGIPQSALADIKPFAYRDAYSTSLRVVQPLYNGGAEIVALDAADATQDKSQYEYQDTEQDVIARVKIAYLNVLKAEELVNLTKESAERTKRWLEMTERRQSLGSRTRTDVLRFKVQLATDEGNIVDAENTLAAARLQLNELMGVGLDKEYVLEKISLPDSSAAMDSRLSIPTQLASFQLASTQQGIDGSFLATHPSMRMMEMNLRLASISVDKAWVNFKPRVNLMFEYGWERNNTLALDGIKPWALSLSVNFPVFNSFGDYTNLERSKAEYKRAKEQVESFRRGLLVQVRNAQLSVNAAQKRIAIAKIGLEQALEVLNSVTRRYDAGAASNVDLIDAQTAYASAKTSHITAIYDHYISEVQLARATGTVNQ